MRIFEGSGGRPHQITKTVWGRDTLFNDRIVTHHRREIETRTCRVNQTEAVCETQGDPRFEVFQWAPLAVNFPPQATAAIGASTPLLYAQVAQSVGGSQDPAGHPPA